MKIKKNKDSKNKYRIRSAASQQQVFSYYSQGNRNQEPRAKTSKLKNIKSTKIIKELPTIIAALVIVFSIVFASTLSTSNPGIKVVSLQNATESIDTTKYEDFVANQLRSKFINKSKILINTKQIENDMQKTFPELSGAAVTIPLIARTPVVLISVETPALLLGTSSSAYAISHSGRIIAESNQLPSSLLSDVPVVQDEAELPAEVGQVALPIDLVEFILDTVAQSKVDNISIDTLKLPTVANELHIQPSGKQYIVKLNTERSARVQLGGYLAYLTNQQKDGLIEPTEYVDLRVGDKVYIK